LFNEGIKMSVIHLKYVGAKKSHFDQIPMEL